MIPYRLQIAIQGSLRDNQYWTSAKKTQQVLEPSGLRELKAAWQTAHSGLTFLELRFLVPPRTNMTHVASIALAHFILALRTYQPSPDDPVMRYKPQPEQGLFGPFSQRELYRGPWEAFERAQAQTGANEHLKEEAQKLTFVCAYGHTPDTYEPLDLPDYFKDDIPTLTDAEERERARVFLVFHSFQLNRLIT